MTDHPITYVHGFSESLRNSAACLYDSAFGAKFSTAVPQKERRISLLSESFCPAFAFCAMHDRELVGLAGYHCLAGSLTGGINYRGLLARLGLLRGNWAAMIFSLYERKRMANELVMDGIAVDERFQGRGIGSKLLGMVADFAATDHCTSVRLDVIDTNPRAQSLYERNGFVVTKTERFEYLRWLLGFGASTTLELRLQASPNKALDTEPRIGRL